jgi:hypothetical protein
LARVLDKRKARKEAEGQTTSSTSDTKKTDGGKDKEGGKEKEGEKKERAPAKYRQREVADRSKGMEKKGMDSVLGSVFG